MINVIVACDTEHGIGKNGGLPWPHHPEDMRWFRENTLGHVVVMGRKTWESIGRTPLPRRINVVVTSNPRGISGYPDVVSSELDLKALQSQYPDLKIWVIGGGEIYKQAIPFADRLYLTKFKRAYGCDTFLDPDQLTGFIRLIDSKNSDLCSFSVWSRT